MVNGCGPADGFGLPVIGHGHHILMQSGFEVVGAEDLTVGTEHVDIGGNLIPLL